MKSGVIGLPASNGDDQIHGHQQDTLQPVRLAVGNEVVDEKNRHEQQDHLERIELESL